MHAAAMLEQLEALAFPHISDEKVRKAIVGRYQSGMAQGSPEPPKSAEEQYQALLLQMKVGG